MDECGYVVSLVYRVTCVPTGKLYFGVTRNSLQRRKRRHYHSVKNGSQCLFHKALRKYDPDSFLWEVVEEHGDRELAYAQEIELIAEYRTNTVDRGYNGTGGGEGALGFRHSAETKAKLSQIVKDWFAADPSRRERVRLSRQGKQTSFGTRIKMSEARRGQTRSDAFRVKMSELKSKKYVAIRPEVVAFAKCYGVRAAARQYSVDRRTVGRWLKET